MNQTIEDSITKAQNERMQRSSGGGGSSSNLNDEITLEDVQRLI